MHEDAREAGESAVEDDAALAEERAGMHLAVAVAKAAGGLDADGISG
jgi:hypothetical protein